MIGMRYTIAAASLFMLAACSSAAMTPSTPGVPPAPQAQAAATQFRLAPGERSRAGAAEDKKIIIRSVGITYEEKGAEHSLGLNGTCTLHAESNGQVDGCYLSAGNTGYLEKSTFILFSEPNAGGCRVAEGHYRGDITVNKTIPIVFYWVTNKCYKF
jgi:hypothetical protein